MPGRDELPDTLKRSPQKAQETWIKAHDNAVKQYGEGERAHRTAFDALKYGFEKVEDRWVAKEHKGPSDPQHALRGPAARAETRKTLGGVDVYGNTRQELYERAKRLDVPGRSQMTKQQLAEAIARKQR